MNELLLVWRTRAGAYVFLTEMDPLLHIWCLPLPPCGLPPVDDDDDVTGVVHSSLFPPSLEENVRIDINQQFYLRPLCFTYSWVSPRIRTSARSICASSNS